MRNKILAILLISVVLTGIAYVKQATAQVDVPQIVNIFVLPDSADPKHNYTGTQVLKNQNGDTLVDKYAVVQTNTTIDFNVNEFTIDPNNNIGNWMVAEIIEKTGPILAKALKSKLITKEEHVSYIKNGAMLYKVTNILPSNSPNGTYAVAFNITMNGQTVSMYNSTFALKDQLLN